MSYHNLPERFPGMYVLGEDGVWKALKKAKTKKNTCNTRFCSRKSEKSRGGTSRSLCCTTCKLRLWRANNPIKAVFNAVRNKASRRKLEFSLTFEHFESLCLETGFHKTRGRRAEDFHLDRIDCAKGYVDGNIQVITATENCKKRHAEYPRPEKEDDPF